MCLLVFQMPYAAGVMANILTLEVALHKLFDKLEIWFEGTDRVRHSETHYPRRLTTRLAEPVQGLCL